MCVRKSQKEVLLGKLLWTPGRYCLDSQAQEEDMRWCDHFKKPYFRVPGKPYLPFQNFYFESVVYLKASWLQTSGFNFTLGVKRGPDRQTKDDLLEQSQLKYNKSYWKMFWLCEAQSCFE